MLIHQVGPRSQRFSLAIALVALLGSVSGVMLAVWTLPSSAQVPMASGTSVMGPSTLTATQLADNYYAKKGYNFARIPNLNGDVKRLAEIFIAEGNADGVRGDIAFMQSMLETGWLEFKDYGQIRPDFNNFSGILAYDGRPIGTTCEAEAAIEAAGGYKSRCFATPALGVRAQIHKLRSYADASVANVAGRSSYAPSYSRGMAPYWEQFGGSTGIAIWATAPDYGNYILNNMYIPILNRLGLTMPCAALNNPDGTVGSGYWVVDSTGVATERGTAGVLTTSGGSEPSDAVVAVAARPDGLGYFEVTRSGRVHSYGSASSFGSIPQSRIGSPVVGIEATASGNGYWIATADGSVFPFGDAVDHGSLSRTVLRSQVVEITKTPGARGYWLLQEDGSIHAFGMAHDFGSPRDDGSTQEVVALAASASGDGYFVVTASGSVQAFGDALAEGDTSGCELGRAVDIAVARTGNGYWILTADGTVAAFGDAKHFGNANLSGRRAVAFVPSA